MQENSHSGIFHNVSLLDHLDQKNHATNTAVEMGDTQCTHKIGPHLQLDAKLQTTPVT